VRGLCEAVEATFRPIAEQKGLSFLVRVDPGVGDALVTDEQRLRQVLRNLLSNAFKFTDAGHVTLQASLARPALRLGVPTLDNAPRPPLVFAVSDTGIGVAPGKLRHIFEAFQQADGTTSRKFGGTGLGLSISRQIARLLGGAITVESEEGAGSTFSLYLPQDFPFADTVQFPEPAAAGAAGQRSGTPIIVPSPSLPSPSLPSPSLPSPSLPSPSLPSPSAPSPSAPWPALPEPPGTPWPGTPVAPAAVLDRTTVLVVDDDVRNVFALTSALELHGARVLYADAGADGLRLLREHPEVALVLMDVMMPDMDGNETTAAIRRMPGREHLPVLFLTAKAMPGDREKSLAAGASGYITKPVDLDILLRSMLHLLEQPATGADGSPRDPGANAASRPAADDPAADGRAADGRAGDAP
jgi:CheY-like chemotaxis protein